MVHPLNTHYDPGHGPSISSAKVKVYQAKGSLRNGVMGRWGGSGVTRKATDTQGVGPAPHKYSVDENSMAPTPTYTWVGQSGKGLSQEATSQQNGAEDGAELL